MNKRKGVVELKSGRVAFLFFHLKRIVIFFFEGAHGVGFGHGVLLLIDGPCSGLFFYFYLHSVVESRNPLPAQIYTYKYIYTHTYAYLYIHKYIYIYIYLTIFMFMREGGSSNAEPQNHDLSHKVT